MIGSHRKPNAELRTREHLSENEVEQLMEAARKNREGHRDALMILMAYRHGLRASELCDLQWSQIELDGGVIHILGSIIPWHSLGWPVIPASRHGRPPEAHLTGTFEAESGTLYAFGYQAA